MRGIFDEEDLDFLLAIIPKMDNWWLEDFYKKQEAERKKREAAAKAKASQKRGRR
mgnify:CR=1 FL=1